MIPISGAFPHKLCYQARCTLTLSSRSGHVMCTYRWGWGWGAISVQKVDLEGRQQGSCVVLSLYLFATTPLPLPALIIAHRLVVMADGSE